MFVSDVMTAQPQTCEPDDSLNRAAQIMWETDCGCVPVVNDRSQVVGVLTDRDICVAAYTQGKPLSEIPVSSALPHRKPVQCRDDTDLAVAEALMGDNGVRRLPVVDKRGRLVGVLSLKDLALESASKKRGKGITGARVGALLAKICVEAPKTHL
jgi:CBS domain-containing protein